jgi:1-acyl-sn-glycerol-3-phosphate acyltransferase
MNTVPTAATVQPTAPAEPRSSRWKRRAITIPTMLGATTVAVLGFPVIVVALAVADLLRGRRHLPTVRAYLFVTQYGINDSVEILIAPWYWLRDGFGTRFGTPSSIRRHERIQRWSIALLARRAEQLLGLRVELSAGTDAALEPAPAIVLCRHVSLLDASLPSLLYQQRDYHVRSVVMAELLADAGFDLLYGRLGSIFIPRDKGPEARAAVGDLGSTLDRSTVAVIFPEGRLFRRDLLEHVRARLSETDPDRARGLTGLRHILPIRPGGVGALLDAAPDADIVVIAHAGLDPYPDFRTLARHVPLTTPVRVAAWRIPRDRVPTQPDERTRWLDTTWQQVDDWVDEQSRR